MSEFIKTGNQIGRGIALFRLIIVSLLASSMSASGIAMITKKPIYTSSVEGVYGSVECKEKKDENGRLSYECNLNYTYEIDGTSYTGIQNSKRSSIQIQSGEKVTVYYNPKNHADSTLDRIPSKKIGFGLILSGLCIVLLSLIVYEITRKVKGAGTLLTGATAYNFLTD
jgi:hypothetical protein